MEVAGCVVAVTPIGKRTGKDRKSLVSKWRTSGPFNGGNSQPICYAQGKATRRPSSCLVASQGTVLLVSSQNVSADVGFSAANEQHIVLCSGFLTLQRTHQLALIFFRGTEAGAQG